MKTTEEFVIKCKNKFGDNLDYSKVKYVDSKTKVCIICPEHGKFWQTPGNFLAGTGCPKCAIKRRTSKKDTFIKRAIEVHGDKYDYSKVEYKKSKEKVCIVCPEHGEFWQKPNTHLNGRGCPKCGVKHKVNDSINKANDFIEKAKSIHGDKYDYSKVEYKKSKEKVCIICPKHGEFWQKPENHLAGKGCKKCGAEKTKIKNKYSTEEFIKIASIIHNNKYDYSKVVYNGCDDEVCIICPEHGEFWQKPKNHLTGRGCKKCGNNRISERKRKTTKQFINDSIKVHGDKYDYSKVEYSGAHDKVCIICPEHGEFWQKPNDHLSGKGCPMCNESKLEKEVSLILEKNHIKFERWKHFPWLGKQSLDFYLNEYNIGIECQGIQHFKPVDFGGKGLDWAEQQLETNKQRDKKKEKICNENGVSVLYFSTEMNMNGIINNENDLVSKIYAI